LVRGTDLSMIS